MISPSPSQDVSTPASSSARSPGSDFEWYSDAYHPSQTYGALSPPSSVTCFTPGLPIRTEKPPESLFVRSDSYPCVNMSQVQGFADSLELSESQDTVFPCDERYMDVEQVEHSIEVDHQAFEAEETRTLYRPLVHSNKFGATRKEEEYIQEQVLSPAATETDADPEGDDEMLDDRTSDSEYTPKGRRTNRRNTAHASKSLSSSSMRRGRDRKSKSLRSSKPSKLSSSTKCKICKTVSKDPTSAQKHMNTSHPRTFTCVFNFAGCTHTFASKNEWKRHVTTQHLNFNIWMCNLGGCGKAHSSDSTLSLRNGGARQANKTATFNRKDLFTQHLRRMHSPAFPKRQDKRDSEWEDRIKELQNSCMCVLRQPPTALKCPVPNCEILFEGDNCWDERMEHVARHLEKVAGTQDQLAVQHENDVLLVGWAVEERIIERVGSTYTLIQTIAVVVGSDEDADGEDE